MNHAEHSFTPVRRREDTVYSYTTHTSGSIPWTASRCNRLLRPIRSRIELLRKDAGGVVPVTTQFVKIGAKASRCELEHRCTKQGKDPNPPWLPCRKKGRQTYGGRCKLLNSSRSHPAKDDCPSAVVISAAVPGSICIPTPILSRVKSEGPCNTDRTFDTNEETENPEKTRRSQSKYTTRDSEAHHKLTEQLRQVRRDTKSSRFTLYDGVYNALEALLKATEATNLILPTKSSSARSLLSTCLRAVPRWIKKEEEWMKRNTEEQRAKSAIEIPDLSAQTYSDLESYGCAEVGWVHLRTVVRAHGVFCISDAIYSGLIDARLASAMVMLCIHIGSLEEAEELLTSLLQSSRYPEPKSVHSQFSHDPALLPLSTLLDFSKYTGRTGYLHRQLASLFNTRMLPVTWLATNQMSSVWTSVFRSLSVNVADAGASSFLTSVLPIFDGNHKSETQSAKYLLNVLHTTFESALTTVTAIALLRAAPAPGQLCTDPESPQHCDKVIQIIIAFIIEYGLFRTKLSNVFAGTMALSSLLCYSATQNTCANDFDFVDEIVGVIQTTSTTNDGENRLPMFLCSVTRCCGRGTFNCGFGYLKLIIQNIHDQSENSPIARRYSLRQLIIDTAYTFAQQLPALAHLEYAESLSRDELVPQPPLIPSNTSKREAGSFRWEEGISEWVTATPSMVQEKSIAVGVNSHDAKSQDDTPIKSTIKRRKLTGTSSRLEERAKTYRSSNPKHCLPNSISYALPKYKKDRHEALSTGRNIHAVRKTVDFDLSLELLSDSDDELSVVTFQSKNARQAFQELSYLHNCELHSRKRATASFALKRRSSSDQSTSLLTESDDELGF